MQSSTFIAGKIAEIKGLIADDERRLADLQVSKAMADLSKADASELKVMRSRVRDRRDELADLTVALRLAEDFEKSAAGQARLEQIADTMRRVEAVGIALKRAGLIEDQAATAYVAAVDRRRALQTAMLDQARQVAMQVRPNRSDDPLEQQAREARFAEILAHLRTAAEGGVTVAQAWRLMQLAQGPEFHGLVTFGPGLTWNNQARLTVEHAAGTSLNGLLLRLGSLLQAAGIPTPERDDQATHEHAAVILESLQPADAPEAG